MESWVRAEQRDLPTHDDCLALGPSWAQGGYGGWWTEVIHA